ncbi:hypothetical protein GOP47_0008067 [Adiantum capillus-veneris]|uniref:Autophagy-related protein 2 n=1 Tax=Adiantum capillus-veneris TaxID=13818 RepID=A0A9D4UYZ5_ADICA|nr:hypothetical protein GOP47_0008067 [Adiantum capillus-veneris]
MSMPQWILRRFLKVCLKKYIGPYILGELDLDQLDFHLCSVSHLNEVVLNVDAINAKLSKYPFALKEGSVGRVTIKLLPHLYIELDGVELQFVPPKNTDESQPYAPFKSSSEPPQLEADTCGVASVGVEGNPYSPVREGVRMVADLFKRLFFGVHVVVNRVYVAIEEMPKLSTSEVSNLASHCMLLCRIGSAEYSVSRSADTGGDRKGEESSSFTSNISFQQLCLEVVDVCCDGREELSSGEGSSKGCGRPVSLMEDEAGLSGQVKISLHPKSGCSDMPKIDFDVSLDHIKLHFTAQQIERLSKMISSYHGTDGCEVATAQGVDQTSQIAPSSGEFFLARKAAGMLDRKEATPDKPGRLGSDCNYSRYTLFSDANYFADWAHCNDREKGFKAPMSEEDLAASTEEFFDCVSGLWTSTCSGFTAVSAASSLLFGSVLPPQASARQVSHVIDVKIAGFSVRLEEDLSRDHFIEIAVGDIDFSGQVSQRRLDWQLLLKHIEAYQVQYQKQGADLVHVLDEDILSKTVRVSAQPLQALVEQSVPKFPVFLSEGSQTRRASGLLRKCFLRLSDQGHLAGLQVDAKPKLPPILDGERNRRRQDLTEYSFHFQPLVVWVDTSTLCTLLNWAESFGISASDGERASYPDSGFSPRVTQKVHLNMYFSRIRLWVCSPYSSGSAAIQKDHMLCLDLSCPVEKFRRPMVKLRLPDSVGDQLCIGSAILAFEESYLYLVSPSIQSEGSEKDSPLKFHANTVLSISLCSPELATVEIFIKTKIGEGMSLVERAWNGIAEQQKAGIGGGKTSSEFVAVTATDVTSENNRKLRGDISLFSSTCIFVAIPKAKIELLASQHTIAVDILTSLLAVTMSKQSLNGQKDNNQVSVSVDVGEAEIQLHPHFDSSSSLKTKTNTSWEMYTIKFCKLQMLHVVKLGMVNNASYFWVRHGNGCIKGLLSNESNDELQLVTFNDDTLGRGDGGGGNVLATKSSGIEVSVMSWHGGGHPEDMLISVVLGGCTFMAHGGRLDWLPGLITFFSEHDEPSNNYAIYENNCLPTTKTGIVRLPKEAGEDASLSNDHVRFSLDLHDAALCYEPGKEAVSAAILRARNTTEQFDPVACLLAAAAVHVSSNATSNSARKSYEIWLRDVALLLTDTTLRRSNVLDFTDFTLESLNQAGYVKVAGEAVMEAVIHINGVDGLEWEAECANNQLRLDTCHDTTAAFGRLIAQLQQLFSPAVELSVSKQSDKPDIGNCCIEKIPGHQLDNGDSANALSGSSIANSESAALLEGFLEDACLLARGYSVHSCCNCLVAMHEKSLLHSKSPQPGDDVAQASQYRSLEQWSQGCGEEESLRTPVAKLEEAPSFIEGYYAIKTSSPHLSSQNYCNSVEGASIQTSQTLSDDFNKRSGLDGSGGWYDGRRFKVVENHVQESDNRSGSQEHRDNLPHSSKRRFGLSFRYPESVGRVVFQDLKLRWRLYRGSDWPISKRKDLDATGGRQNEMCMELILHGVNLQYDIFPRMGIYASRLALSIEEAGIYDCSKNAPWKKVLGYHWSKSRPRESSAKALKLELESVRPNPLVPVEEYRLSVQLLPILLHLDQRHVEFLANFFSAPALSSQGNDEVASSYSSFELKVAEGSEDALLPFFQICELQSFSIRVDYVPRHVDIGALKCGNYAELANLVPWKGIELELKHVRTTAVRGWETLSSIVVAEWMEDISQNQIHKLLKGLGPIRPLFAVGSGAAKLVLLPAEQYKRDRRRLLQGIRKGAKAFLRSISLEAVGLGVQLTAGAHEMLLQTELALGSFGFTSSLEQGEVRTKAGQPGDMREGLLQAYESLSQGLERTASSLIGQPLKAYHKEGPSMAVASALRAAPSAAVAPAVAAAGALHCALLGLRSSLDPERRRESEEKHSEPPH